MKNLIILYPGGAGGNHLANLISTNDKFQPRIDSKNYHFDILNSYTLTCNSTSNETELENILFLFNAHLRDVPNDLVFFSENQKNSLSTEKINVLCGHLNHYIHYYPLLNSLDDLKFIIISVSRPNSLLLNRLKSGRSAKNLKHGSPITSEVIYYSEFVVSKLSGKSPENIFTISGNTLFTDDLSELKALLKNFFNIDLPPVADEIHAVWFNKIIEQFYS